ncbi:MAG TPA: hypothetical protein VFV38_19130 [Ktedonobacteraceae bacterium]|nr:hypothetical protein [Ktedonobacteraceae bacterium]
MITPDNLRTLLRKHRWTIAISTSGRQQVFAAKQRRGKKLATCYIGTSNKLAQMTEEDVVEKITRRAAKSLVPSSQTNDQAHTEQRLPSEAPVPVIPIIPAEAWNPQAGG